MTLQISPKQHWQHMYALYWYHKAHYAISSIVLRGPNVHIFSDFHKKLKPHIREMQKQSRQVWLFPAPTVHPLHDADIAGRNKYRCDLRLIDIFFCNSVGGLLYKYVYASLPRFHPYPTQIWGLNDCPTSPSVDIRIRRFSICHVLPQRSMSRLHCRFVICIFCDNL